MSLPEQIDKYEIIEEIGRGGYGIVYRARRVDLDREVALKVMPANITMHGDLVERFRQEAKAVAKLKHAHIASVLDYGEVDSSPFIALEFASGRSLRQWLDERDTLPMDQALIILSQLAGALDHSHERDFIHRDVKPSNIIVEFRNEGPYAVLTDFGLVKALQQVSKKTSAGTLTGTFEYMAPEACDLKRAEEVGPSADLYSLGVVAYEMLTGQVPFPGGNSPAVLHSQIHDPPPDPSSLNPDLPQPVSKVLLKMLAKSPQARYASGRDFVRALRAATKERRAPVWPKVAAVAALLVFGLFGLALATRSWPFNLAPIVTTTPTFTLALASVTPPVPDTEIPPSPDGPGPSPILEETQPAVEAESSPTIEISSTSHLTPEATEPAKETEPPPTETSSPSPVLSGLLAYPEYNSARQTFAVKVYDLAQKNVVGTVDQASQPAISPDGTRIAYHSWDTSALGLFSKNVGTSGSSNQFSGLLEAYRPQWRDNERLVFTFVQGGSKDIRYVDNTGIRTPGQATTPAWLPDGRLIFNGCLDVRCGLMITDEGGGNPELMTDRTGDLTPAVAPDGQHVAFMSDRDGNWEIYLLDLKSRETRRLTDNPVRDGLPVFSPDGNKVAFVSERGGQWGIWLLDWRNPGSEESLLPILGGIEGPVANISPEQQPGWVYESISWR